MSENFMILGLPRSRTCWLSNFMTTTAVYCHHELVGYCSSKEEYRDKMDLDYEYVGDSDTAGLLLHNDYDCPKVIIHRDINDVHTSLVKLFGYNKEFLPSLYKWQGMLKQVDGLHIDFNEIDNNLEQIWKHCVDLPYDKLRAEKLMNTKIEAKHLNMFENIDFLLSLEVA